MRVCFCCAVQLVSRPHQQKGRRAPAAAAGQLGRHVPRARQREHSRYANATRPASASQPAGLQSPHAQLLVCECEYDAGARARAGHFSLSVRDRDPEKGENIKHYRLARTDAGQYFFDLTKKPKYFASLDALIEHFSGASRPLTSPLLTFSPDPSSLHTVTQLCTSPRIVVLYNSNNRMLFSKIITCNILV